jgi:hypothetical protein
LLIARGMSFGDCKLNDKRDASKQHPSRSYGLLEFVSCEARQKRWKEACENDPIKT